MRAARAASPAGWSFPHRSGRRARPTPKPGRRETRARPPRRGSCRAAPGRSTECRRPAHMDSFPWMLDFSDSFKWFAEPVERRPQAHGPEAKRRLTQLWMEVRRRIGEEEFDSVLGSVRAGKLATRSEGAWVQTNGEKDYNFVNMTLELDAAELSLNVIGWFDTQFAKMERWMGKPSAWRFLRELPE